LELTPGDGLKTVYFQILDVYMWMFSETFSDTIILDTVAPTTIILHDPGSATFSLSATDNVSPTIRTCYILDQQQNSLRIYTGPFTLTGAGSHRIDYYSIDEAGNEAWGTPLRVHYLHVNTEPEGIAAISGRGWYDENTIATTGTAPDTIPFYNIAFAFSTWKKDGTPVTGNPANIFMDAPHTATAFYTVPLLPVANFTQSPLNPKVGELTTFDASNSTPNGGTIEWYFWDFNDTTTINGTAIETHAFASPETYNVTLTIRDSEGLTDMTWQLVTVISAVKHDISILNVTTSTPHQYPGRPVNITLAVKNNGEVSETFNVTVYRNSTTAIGTILVTDLGIGENTTVIFNWDTTGLIPCHNWTISAEAPIVGDINPGDNNFTDGTVKIVMIGDVNADGVVDGQDVVIIIEAIPSYPGHPWWNPQADLDNDGVVDGADVVITLINLGKTT
jgi:PKD repeat protein